MSSGLRRVLRGYDIILYHVRKKKHDDGVFFFSGCFSFIIYSSYARHKPPRNAALDDTIYYWVRFILYHVIYCTVHVVRQLEKYKTFNYVERVFDHPAKFPGLR